jgi:hypothetical protein
MANTHFLILTFAKSWYKDMVTSSPILHARFCFLCMSHCLLTDMSKHLSHGVVDQLAVLHKQYLMFLFQAVICVINKIKNLRSA